MLNKTIKKISFMMFLNYSYSRKHGGLSQFSIFAVVVFLLAVCGVMEGVGMRSRVQWFSKFGSVHLLVNS